MIYCVRCTNIRAAHEELNNYLLTLTRKNSKDLIKEIRRYRTYPLLIMKDGSEIHFITTALYRTWCKGRTYKIVGDDKTYHSGHPIQDYT